MLRDIYQYFTHLFDTHGWVPRWVCGRWTEAHGWMYIISSLLIGLAYFAIPLTLYRFIRKRKDILPFNKVFWLFILFIFSCGVTHFTDAAMFWYPAYRFSAMVLLITAIVSWIAVFILFKVIPVALSFKSPAQLENIIQQRTADLAAMNTELTFLNEQLKEANQKTEQLIQQKDEFLNIASHELKTPVTSLKATLQMAESFAKINTQSQHVFPLVTKANKQIVRLTSLIEDLLDITKIQSGKLLLEPSGFSLSEALTEWVQGAVFYANHHRIIFENGEDYEVEADRNRLEQVVVNLLSNAVKYSPDADRIIVSVSKEYDVLTVRIKDFGIGIPKDKIPFVFDRFFRAKEGQTYTGLGLGLYISSQIIKQHGGEIGVESEENKGSTFWFTLPLQNVHQLAS